MRLVPRRVDGPRRPDSDVQPVAPCPVRVLARLIGRLRGGEQVRPGDLARRQRELVPHERQSSGPGTPSTPAVLLPTSSLPLSRLPNDGRLPGSEKSLRYNGFPCRSVITTSSAQNDSVDPVR